MCNGDKNIRQGKEVLILKNIALIFAGGVGKRMCSEIPKQFLKISGKEIIIHTIEKFEENKNIDQIYVVCIEKWIPYLNELIKKYGIKKTVAVIPGGETGQDSIFCGLKKIKEKNKDAIVLIHDGVRPLITEETINKCISTVKEFDSAITVTPCFETPIVSNDGNNISTILDRRNVYSAQAPQGFYLDEIYNIHLKERKINPSYENIVDSASLYFKYKNNCKIFIGNRGNIKVTTPEDFCMLIGNFASYDYSEYLKLPKDK